jgi:hypothetical protein
VPTEAEPLHESERRYDLAGSFFADKCGYLIPLGRIANPSAPARHVARAFGPLDGFASSGKLKEKLREDRMLAE